MKKPFVKVLGIGTCVAMAQLATGVPARAEDPAGHGDIALRTGRSTGGQSIAGLQYNYARPLVRGGSADEHGMLGPQVDTAFRGHVDLYTKEDKARVGARLELSGATLLRNETTDGRATYGLSKDEFERLSRDKDAETTLSFDRYESCRELEAMGRDLDANHCLEGLPSDRAAWTSAQAAEFRERKVPTYKLAVRGKNSVTTTFLSLSGVYERNPQLDHTVAGAKLEVAGFDIKLGAPLSKYVSGYLCANGSASAYIGHASLRGHRSSVMGEMGIGACAGVAVPGVGSLTYDVKAAMRDTRQWDQRSIQGAEHAVTLGQLGGTSLFLRYSYDRKDGMKRTGIESAVPDQTVRTHFFSVGAAN